MGSTEQIVGLDFRITLLGSCSDTGQNDTRTEDDRKSGYTTGEEVVCWSTSERISRPYVFHTTDDVQWNASRAQPTPR